MEGGGFREWIAGLGRREAAVLLLVGLAIAGGAGLWYVRSLPKPVEIQEARAGPVAAPSPSVAPIVVHVAGEVRSPGVYELAAGDRVVDAIERAGGTRKRADLRALNLAAVLTDGQQVLVPAKVKGGAAAASGGGGPEPKVNLNTATQEELEGLPGIGPVLAQAILDYREEHGPFASVEDLLDVSGIGDSRLEDLRDLVAV